MESNTSITLCFVLFILKIWFDEINFNNYYLCYNLAVYVSFKFYFNLIEGDALTILFNQSTAIMFIFNLHFVKLYIRCWSFFVFNPFWLGATEDLQVLTTPFFTINKDLFRFIFIFIVLPCLAFIVSNRKLSCVTNLLCLYFSTSISGFETATLAHYRTPEHTEVTALPVNSF